MPGNAGVSELAFVGLLTPIAGTEYVNQVTAGVVDIAGRHELAVIARERGGDGIVHVGRGAHAGRTAGEGGTDDARARHGREVGSVLRLAALGEGVAAIDHHRGSQDDGRE